MGEGWIAWFRWTGFQVSIAPIAHKENQGCSPEYCWFIISSCTSRDGGLTKSKPKEYRPGSLRTAPPGQAFSEFGTLLLRMGIPVGIFTPRLGECRYGRYETMVLCQHVPISCSVINTALTQSTGSGKSPRQTKRGLREPLSRYAPTLGIDRISHK
jgi:hypothetical protein